METSRYPGLSLLLIRCPRAAELLPTRILAGYVPGSQYLVLGQQTRTFGGPPQSGATGAEPEDRAFLAEMRALSKDRTQQLMLPVLGLAKAKRL